MYSSLSAFNSYLENMIVFILPLTLIDNIYIAFCYFNQYVFFDVFHNLIICMWYFS